MLPREVIKKAKKLEVITRRLVNDKLAGQYHSVFKGQGMNFDEVRAYHEGDDVRFIDWNVSARTGDLHIKRFVEERELTVLLVIDVSPSVDFGTAEHTKRSVAAELAAVMAFSAIKNNDRVGLVIFADEVELYIPPKKGRKHVMRVITEVLTHEAKGTGTNVGAALQFVAKVNKRKSVVFVVSDFMAPAFDRDMKIACRRHDVVPIIVEDPMERKLPAIGGLLPVRDVETGATAWLDLGSRTQRTAYEQRIRDLADARDRFFKRMKLDVIPITTDSPYIEPLAAFFKRRARRR